MIARFHERSPYSTFDPAVLEDYCRYGLLPAAGGGFSLACPPRFEAQVYLTARSNGTVYEQVERIDIPVLVVRAMAPPPERGAMDFRYSPTWPGLATRFRRGRDLHLADCTHFFPMEDPALAARLILDPPGGDPQVP